MFQSQRSIIPLFTVLKSWEKVLSVPAISFVVFVSLYKDIPYFLMQSFASGNDHLYLFAERSR